MTFSLEENYIGKYRGASIYRVLKDNTFVAKFETTLGTSRFVMFRAPTYGEVRSVVDEWLKTHPYYENI